MRLERRQIGKPTTHPQFGSAEDTQTDRVKIRSAAIIDVAVDPRGEHLAYRDTKHVGVSTIGE